ncbi:non-ribosomal peptide synthetase [Martelella alba]|uniref:Amino acid adenylation domain-containing protein n=1 Tax=Martelella alba TaxID=2590451 RepID=A0ABY2SJF0_9HYPH|nr:non-ribosomal peptide synthetase [Martelella alba]TKI05599.1 amino acid adenylation domain-containing protein [Martelella alba]
MSQKFISGKHKKTLIQTPSLTLESGFIHRLVRQAELRPHHPAIVTKKQSINYIDLVHQSAALAQTLLTLGVTHEMPIAILLPLGIEQIICQIGVLMAGASCLPVDPTTPVERINIMLEDLQVRWIIGDNLPFASSLTATLLDINELFPTPETKINITDIRDIKPNHRTHILFTSGSTGKPKAVQIEAKGIWRVTIDPQYMKITENDRVANIVNPTFDVSLAEVWGALFNGATLVTITKEDMLDIAYFQEQILQQKISVLFMTTALFNLVAANYPHVFAHINYLLIAGETLNPHMVALIMHNNPPKHIINGYGPTECTAFALCHEVTMEDVKQGNIPIGRPIKETTAVILDEHRQPVAAGEIGNLYLGGEGLSRGYWNRDDLNNKSFIQASLSQTTPLQRLYHTGDRCWQRPDGIFLYVGRTDNQIKLRGQRIEIGEIEYQLMETRQLKAGVVCLVNDGKSDPYLAAFIIPYAPDNWDKAQLLLTLQKYLPRYMLPRLYIVNDIPLTINGKADKRLLIEQFATDHSSEQVQAEPLSADEHALQQLWRQILNIAHIGANDNFFYLGGSSLQAARLLVEIRRHFHCRLTLQALYEAPTLREMTKRITQSALFPDQIDTLAWRKDSILPDDIQPLPTPCLDWNKKMGATVLLTGATGFLGAFFLRDLLANAHIKKIVCLVRAPDEGSARQRITKNSAQYGLSHAGDEQRIIPLVGDLSMPYFGLNHPLYLHLAGQCDVIFHLAAHVNYSQPYQPHRATNVEGTLNILRFASCIINKPLHYLSTITAFGPAHHINNTRRLFEDEDLAPYFEGLAYDSGYAQSKWVAEQLLWTAQKRGMPLAVYRPGFIMGDTITGAGNPKDFVARMVRGCIQINAAPILPHQRKDFSPVNYVSAALLAIAGKHANLGKAYHLVPPDDTLSIDMETFFSLLDECGFPLQMLTYPNWVKRLEDDPHLETNPLLPLLPILNEPVLNLRTRWEVYENMPTYDTANTRQALSALDFPLSFTPLDKSLLARYLSFWQRGGYLPARQQ